MSAAGIQGQSAPYTLTLAPPKPRALAVTFTASGTWRAPADGYVAVLLIGAGGSGSAAATSGATACRASGPGAGGVAFKIKKVRRGDVLTVALGAGGAARVLSAPGTVQGLPGGNSSVTGRGGLNMVCKGGQGGLATSGSTAAVAGGLGGMAYGGDINLQGGNGGDIASLANALGLSTGGGAPNLLGLPCNGGAITAATNLIGTGGGGVSSSGATGTTLGGTDGGRGTLANVNQFWPSNDQYYDLIKLAGTGTAGVQNTNSANATNVGEGSGGVRQSTAGSLSSGSAVLGGTGAVAADSQTVATTGAPTYGGGSGSIAGSAIGVSCTFTVAAGGQALCLLAFYPGA